MANLLIYILPLWIIIDFYIFYSLKTVTAGIRPRWRKVLRWAYWLPDIIIFSLLLALSFSGSFRTMPRYFTSCMLAWAVLSLAPKVFMLPFLLLEDVVRLVSAAVVLLSRLFSKKKQRKSRFSAAAVNSSAGYQQV